MFIDQVYSNHSSLLNNKNKIFLPFCLISRLQSIIIKRHPKKSFGYFLSRRGLSNTQYEPSEFIVFSNDLRKSWTNIFEGY